MVKLSIIIPLYNGASYIRNSIESIEDVNVGIKDALEIIVVDDGSTDDGASVVKRLCELYSNIVLLHKENGGIASAREFGLNYATGDYITFCDQDDSVLASYSDFIELACSSEADVLMCGHFLNFDGKLKPAGYVVEERVYRDTDCRVLSNMLFCPEVFTPADADQRHLFQVPVTIWNCIFSTQFLRNNGIHFRSSVTYEDDWVFVGTVLSYCSCLVVTPKAYYSWTINPQSRSHTSVFIPNYFSKRSQHRELMLTTAARSGGAKKELEAFAHILDAQTIVCGGRNAMLLPLRSYLKEIKAFSAFGSLWSYRDFKISKLSSLYLYLWSIRFNITVYLLNRFLVFIRDRRIGGK